MPDEMSLESLLAEYDVFTANLQTFQAELRPLADQLKADAAKLKDTFTSANQEKLDTITKIEAQIEACREKLCCLAREALKLEGRQSGKLDDRLTVKDVSMIEITDTEAAIVYVVASPALHHCLSLNAKALLDHLKHLKKLPAFAANKEAFSIAITKPKQT